MIWATVICDASFSPFRKDGAGGGIGGWAAWIRIDNVLEAIKGHGVLKGPVLNSTHAEVYAALNGIWLARKHGAEGVLVRSDCMAVIHLISGEARPGTLRNIWRDALERRDMRGVQLKGEHVKGHGVIKCRATWVNDWADRTAKDEMRRARHKYRSIENGWRRHQKDRQGATGG